MGSPACSRIAAVASAKVPLLMTRHLSSYGNSSVTVSQPLVISNYWILTSIIWTYDKIPIYLRFHVKTNLKSQWILILFHQQIVMTMILEKNQTNRFAHRVGKLYFLQLLFQ